MFVNGKPGKNRANLVIGFVRTLIELENNISDQKLQCCKPPTTHWLLKPDIFSGAGSNPWGNYESNFCINYVIIIIKIFQISFRNLSKLSTAWIILKMIIIIQEEYRALKSSNKR
jgi:hypothetical protein